MKNVDWILTNIIMDHSLFLLLIFLDILIVKKSNLKTKTPLLIEKLNQIHCTKLLVYWCNFMTSMYNVLFLKWWNFMNQFSVVWNVKRRNFGSHYGDLLGRVQPDLIFFMENYRECNLTGFMEKVSQFVLVGKLAKMEVYT